MEDYPFHGSEAPHTAAYLWPPVLRLLGEASHATGAACRVVDVGAGNGAFAAHLAGLGFQVTAIEPSASGIEALRAAHPGLEHVRASAYDDLSALHGTFDAAVALEVVEHCYFPRRLTGTLAALVRPGGIVVISTPFHGYWKNLTLAVLGRWDEHLTALWDHGHIKFWSARTLGTLVAESGLVVERIVRVGRIPALAKSLVLLARKPGAAGRT